MDNTKMAAQRAFEKTFQEQLGKRIRALRTERGLTQEALALDAHMAPSMLGKLERGERNPQLSTLLRISTALKVAPSELLELNAALPAPELSPYIQNMTSLMQNMTVNEQKTLYDTYWTFFSKGISKK